jgi:hypothetical protein
MANINSAEIGFQQPAKYEMYKKIRNITVQMARDHCKGKLHSQYLHHLKGNTKPLEQITDMKSLGRKQTKTKL